MFRDVTGELSLAIQHNDTKKMKEALAAGARIHARYHGGYTHLHNAVMRDSLKPATLKILLAHKLDINAKTRHGNTPLHLVRNPKIAKLLIAAGANINTPNNGGYTPLDGAKNGEKKEIELLLTAAGAIANNPPPREKKPRIKKALLAV